MSDTDNQQHLIIYNTADGKAAVSLYARDGNVWMNQSQLAELFATSVPNINTHISKLLKEKELDANSVIKDYLITVLKELDEVAKTITENKRNKS